MAMVRKNVWAQGGDFTDPTILWYARGVKAMKARSLDDITSWGFFGGIHGFNDGLWQLLGFTTTPAPSDANQQTFWQQCQHGSWYFEPWHRGYLMALEAMIRDAVVKAGGPTDWALPYWNYFGPSQSQLPPAFATPDWPDGQGDNPLFLVPRYGPDNNGNVFIPLDQVNMDALGDADFVGPADGASPGFGGVVTGFSNGGDVHGGIESQPHDLVHVFVGGGTRTKPGAMAVPDSAGLDPIFYLHHANIDRLWQIWRLNPSTHVDPVDQSNWVNGPPAVGERGFAMPNPDGTTWTYTPGDVNDFSRLTYTYDDLSPATDVAPAEQRAQILGVTRAAASPPERTDMATPRNVELFGASDGDLHMSGKELSVPVALDTAVHARAAASFATAATNAVLPDRVFLNLEHVRSKNDAASFSVYVNVPEGEKPADHPECKAGSIGLFGARKASDPNGAHAGNGLTYVLEITRMIDALYLAGKLTGEPLNVQLVATRNIDDDDQVTIGRISVFRHAA